MSTIKLLEREIELAPLRGRKDAKYLRELQAALEDIISSVQSAIGAASIARADDIAVPELLADVKVLNAISKVVLSDGFLNDILPIFWMCSTEKLSKKQALAIIDDSEFSPKTGPDVLQAIISAMNFWSPEDPEAVEEAVKKSSADEESE